MLQKTSMKKAISITLPIKNKNKKNKKNQILLFDLIIWKFYLCQLPKCYITNPLKVLIVNKHTKKRLRTKSNVPTHRQLQIERTLIAYHKRRQKLITKSVQRSYNNLELFQKQSKIRSSVIYANVYSTSDNYISYKNITEISKPVRTKKETSLTISVLV